jgi:hypothetical protein
MTEEINYKEFADRFYKLLKENAFYRGLPEFYQVMKEYENATKPKMTFVDYSNVERFVYDNKDYVFIDRYWYRCQNGVLIFIEDGDFAEELFVAQLEYEKSKPVKPV